ncbi:hypothetical protein F0919_05390 [Taibaiella lutea]|uniref:Lipoprotein n=1 Tax=Taibaiella lutea TaxID=2608001 RepID=A0A5M6CPD1_9BACT|nr:hypothetical protein [Taibaiella lutea]KAA5537108.1 hypothetical protein F0919_05390 [Taibaiella lutea]
MKIFFKTTFAIISALIFSSCDPQTCGTAYIENQSSGDIYLEVDSNRVDTLSAGQVKTIGPVCGLAQGQTPSAMVLYNSVKNDDTFCRKDIRWDSNWSTIQVEKYKWEHRFTINDSDF